MKSAMLHALATATALLAATLTVLAQSSAFTYQGRLNDFGLPATGTYDLRFTLYDALANGTVRGGPVNKPATPVTNGLFTVALDFGAAAFDGNDRWLEVAAGTNGASVLTPLAPRQPITATPYALRAQTAGTATTVAANGVGTGALMLNAVNSARIQDGTIAPGDLGPALLSNTFWRLGGNVGTTPGTHFLGTADNQPLEFRVNNAPALRLASGSASPNVIGGHSANAVSNQHSGAYIGGGGNAAHPNTVSGDYASVLGGRGNSAGNLDATAMGAYTLASGEAATAMGDHTIASGLVSTAMGASTTAGGNFSMALGVRAKANHPGSFVWADWQSADFVSTVRNEFSLRASGGVRLSDDTPAISFGSTTRQMLNLYGMHFGLGVQDYRLYFRAGGSGADGFAWFAGGQHSSTTGDPGAGGAKLMELTGDGLTVKSGAVYGRGSVPWEQATGTSIQAMPNRGYLADSAALVNVTLPAAPVVGDVVRVVGVGAGGWRISQNGGQSILFPTDNDPTGSRWISRAVGGFQETYVASSADGRTLLAAVVDGGLFSSRDGGSNWIVGSSSYRFWSGVAGSADGNKWVAVALGDWIRTRSGTDTNWNLVAIRTNWTGVASSSDGEKLVAVVDNGLIYTSPDSGTNWTPRAFQAHWRAVASSADGAKLIAGRIGGLHFSADSGVTWIPRAFAADWSAVASSADGVKLLAAVDGGFLYTSSDSGLNWSPRADARQWRAVVSSADGVKLAAVAWDDFVYTSADSGITWTPRALSQGPRKWATLASSADGARLVAGEFDGAVHTWDSTPFRSTTSGNTGHILGYASSAIELVYVGGGRFRAVSREGAVTLN